MSLTLQDVVAEMLARLVAVEQHLNLAPPPPPPVVEPTPEAEPLPPAA